jgi:hypothetical protein
MPFSLRASKGLLLLAVLAGVLGSCSQTGEVISPVPELTLVNTAPTTLRTFSDTLRFTLRYRDGDGDLGQASPDSLSLFLRDLRLNLTIGYRIPQLAPTGARVAIEGLLTVPITRIPLADSTQASEILTYEIWCRDRAGNESNRLTTPPLTLTRN